MAQIRRYIYEYIRYNPQRGKSVRKGEVYETTLKKAERTAIRHCKNYTTYGSLFFKRIIQVSNPIVLCVDVEEKTRQYGEYPRYKTYKEYDSIYTQNHSKGWDELTDI